MRELNRLRGKPVRLMRGGFQKLSEDYEVIMELAKQNQLTIRIAYNWFTQRPKLKGTGGLQGMDIDGVAGRGKPIFPSQMAGKCWYSLRLRF